MYYTKYFSYIIYFNPCKYVVLILPPLYRLKEKDSQTGFTKDSILLIPFKDFLVKRCALFKNYTHTHSKQHPQHKTRIKIKKQYIYNHSILSTVDFTFYSAF